MDRFCDYIKIYRKKGDVYNPFAEKGDEQNGIYTEPVWEGNCKGETTSQNSMLSVSDRMTITVYINENDVPADNRDIAFFKTNNENESIRLTILEVKRYEHNTIIKAIHLKDGDNKEI